MRPGNRNRGAATLPGEWERSRHLSLIKEYPDAGEDGGDVDGADFTISKSSVFMINKNPNPFKMTSIRSIRERADLHIKK